MDKEPMNLHDATLEITVSFPPKALSPNGSHGHWSTVARARKDARLEAKMLTVSAMVSLKPELLVLLKTGDRFGIHFDFFPAMRTEYDDDNLLCSMKSYIDGMCDALLINDARIKGWTWNTRLRPKKILMRDYNPRVEMRIKRIGFSETF